MPQYSPNTPSRTGNLPFGDPLARKQWSKENAVKAGKTSVWRKFSGNSIHSAVYHKTGGLQVGNKGNEIIFDFDGFLAQEPLEGDAQLSGTGENRKKFSATFYTRNFHNTVNIPKEWDLQTIGSMELRRTAKQSKDLWDQHRRVGDQAKFDCAQGFLEHDKPTHIIMPNGKTDIGALTPADRPSLDLLEHTIHSATTGKEINVGGSRPGLKAWADSSATGEEDMVIDLMVDWYFIRALSQDAGWQTLHGLVGANDPKNPLVTSNITVYKNIRIHRVPFFEGSTSKRDINKSAVESAGLRRIDINSGAWQGMLGFNDNSTAMVGNAAIIGAGGMISHSAICPVDPFTIEYTNHKQKAEAANHYYMNVKRTTLFEHNGDYADRKMAGYNLGLINVQFHI